MRRLNTTQSAAVVRAMKPSGSVTTLSRRGLLKAGGVTGLVLGLHLPFASKAAHAAAAPVPTGALAPNAFIRVAPDNRVIVIIKHHEMGQGVTTGLATLAADELDADWSLVSAEYAPADGTLYNNLFFGPMQGTGGSTAIANSYEQMRKAGAAARVMLVQAAAQTWKVPVGEVSAANSTLSHRSGRRATYGEMASAAAKLTPPTDVVLKRAAAFNLIGKENVGRLDSPAKATGQALYTIDVKLPGLLTAVIARPPAFGATVKSFDATAAKAVAGVTDVVQVPEGIAVVATGMWQAIKGREALQIEWDLAQAETRSSADLTAAYTALAKTPGQSAKRVGEAAPALAGAAQTVEAIYEFPYLAHAPMEPLNCVAWLHDGMLETWAGHQFPTIDLANAAKAAGLPPDKVQLHTLVSGGSFGRRANMPSDFVVEAVNVVKAIGGRAPVRVQRTREDDMRAGFYRPLYVHQVRAGIGADGKPVGWEHRIVGQSILAGTAFAGMIKDGIDDTSVEGASTLIYAVPNLDVSLHTTTTGVPPLWWRSVGNTHTAYAVETMIDELAIKAGQDPLAYRLSLLAAHPRHVGVLRLAAERAGWGTPLPAGKARGIAVHESFNTFVAEVAEVSLAADGSVKVERVVCAVDCGVAVNPDVIRAQMEGGIGYGLSAILYGEITIENGGASQGNFDTYEVLHMDAMPKVEVHIVPSTAAPTGVGEPGVPPLAPAVANAVAALTGKRIRSLPFAKAKLLG
jgi:isoquinoline 1-oxidoreductase beta subunit